MESIQPTIAFDSSLSESASNDRDVSRANIGFVTGDRPDFTDETADILQARLGAASIAIAVVLGAAFIGTLFTQLTTFWWLRLLIVLINTALALVLRFGPRLSLSKLRSAELVIFGTVIFQLSVMLLSRLAEFAEKDDPVTMASVDQRFLMAWCVVIFVYGTLIPNRWKRALALMLSMAIIPYVLVAVQSWVDPNVGLLLAANQATAPLPLPLVSACVAAFAAHVINSARREAFKARQFGQYRLMEKIGAGGMGDVFKAEHVLLKRPCAIKLIKPANEADVSVIARFEKEVKATAKLTHWNTIEIYDYGRTDDNTFYYVMELLPGMSLDEIVERHGPMPPERVVYLLRQICGALHEAHSVGMIHRDIKPANIFASKRGGVFDVAKLLDFGLVKEKADATEVRAKQGLFSGTPLYMSPEQASAYDDVDGRADIYSLGAVAYYLVTGQTPFSSRNILELLAAHQSSVVAPPSTLNPNISEQLNQLILKCMAKSPDDRFQNADELGRAFDACRESNQWGSQESAAWWSSIKSDPSTKTVSQGSLDATIDEGHSATQHEQ